MKFTTENIVTMVTAVLLALPGLWTAWIQLRKDKSIEQPKTQADIIESDATASKIYAEASRTYAEEVVELRKQLADLRREIDKVTQKLDEAEQALARTVERSAVMERELAVAKDTLAKTIQASNAIEKELNSAKTELDTTQKSLTIAMERVKVLEARERILSAGMKDLYNQVIALGGIPKVDIMSFQ